jgi:extradiol dioxygenase family protein
MPNPTFHLSIPVSNLEAAQAFYVDTLQCTLGRVGERRIDINFFGHHVVAHLAPDEAAQHAKPFHSDGVNVSTRHFGVIVELEQWKTLEQRLTACEVEFSMAPQVIRSGTIEEQHIMMMPDGCGNIVEVKSISPDQVFAT